MRIARAAVVALALAGSAQAGAAPIWGSASLTDIKITLTDLEPNDGTTPGIQFASGGNTYTTVDSSTYLLGGGAPTFKDYVTAPSFLATLSTSDGHANVAPASMSVAFNLAHQGTSNAAAYAYAIIMTVSRNTQVTVAGLTSVAANSFDFCGIGPDGCQQARASIYIYLGDHDTDLRFDPPQQWQSEYIVAEALATGTTLQGIADSDGRPVSLTYITGNHIGTASMIFSASTSGYRLLPIPEPATGALLLAGLLAIHGVTRARAARHHQRAH